MSGAPREPWTVLGLILWSADYLTEKGVESGRLDAEHLLAHAVGVDRLQLYLQFDRPVTPAERDAFRPLLKRRATREPLQYILGRQPFRELDLEVGPDVLVPRPETEVLVGELLSEVADDGVGLRALDLGTGTGAIALSLAFEGPFASVLATDVAEGALAVARRNSERAGLTEKVEFRCGDWFSALGEGESFDVVVSNPPYVARSDADQLAPEVGEWEPERALFAGEDGLDVLRSITADAYRHLNPKGLLGLEVGSGQAGAVAEMLAATGKYEEIGIRRDYAGKERVVIARCVSA